MVTISQCVLQSMMDAIWYALGLEKSYTGVTRERLARGGPGASDNNNPSKQGDLRKLNKVDKDTNLSEQTLIGISVKNDHEDDKNDANEASIAPLDVSQVTLTGSTVNISGVTGTMCYAGYLLPWNSAL